jgi:hypothetical protein
MEQCKGKEIRVRATLIPTIISAPATAGLAAGAVPKPTLATELVTVPIRPAALPSGWRVAGLQPVSPIDLIVIADRIRGAIPGSVVPTLEAGVTATLADGMQEGAVSWFVTPSTDDSDTLVAELAFPNPNVPADQQGILIPDTQDGWILTTGTAVEDVGSVVIEAVPDVAMPISGDPGQAAALLAFGVKHLRDAKRALAS